MSDVTNLSYVVDCHGIVATKSGLKVLTPAVAQIAVEIQPMGYGDIATMTSSNASCAPNPPYGCGYCAEAVWRNFACHLAAMAARGNSCPRR